MKKFLKSAGIPAALLIGASVSAQAAEAQAATPAPAANPARFAFTAQDTETSKALELALNKHVDLTIEGYLAAAGTFEKYDRKRGNGQSGREYTLFNSQSANLDAAFVGIKAANRRTGLSAYASVLWVPDGKADFNEAGILDAYVSWGKTTSAGTFTVTGGKYLSYYGLESFYAPAMNQLSYGLQSFLPGYHTGIKFDYVSSDERLTLGFSVEDSLFSDRTLPVVNQSDSHHFNQGDGKLGGVGLEATISYKFNQEFSLSAVIGGDTKADSFQGSDFDFCFNLFATYKLALRNGGSLALSGEINYLNRAFKEGNRNYVYDGDRFRLTEFDKNNETTGWALVAQYKHETGRLAGLSALARLSAFYGKNDAEAYQFTLSPGYAFNKHFLVRGEFSWTHGNEDAFALRGYSSTRNNYFFGVQSILTF